MTNLQDNIVEPEDLGTELITVPFNPMSIRIRRDPFTLGQLVDKIAFGEVQFSTPFQRKDDLWDEVKMSRLVESVLLRLPLPAFYFDEADEEKQLWNVIDGLQRCSVFRDFIVNKTLSLVRLEFLTQYNGYSYDGLPRELQRRILQTPLTVYVVESGTPEEVKFNIFKRINTGGLMLNPQEIRHAMNQGVAADYVRDLARCVEFADATGHSIATDRMEDRDFITRFVSFYLLGEHNYEPDLDSFMSRGMVEIARITPDARNQMTDAFKRSMLTAIEIFGNDAFRKRFSVFDRRHPINKTLFEVLSVTIARLRAEQQIVIMKRADLFRNKLIELHSSAQFLRSISSGTGNKENVKKRYEEINRIVAETLNV